MVFISRLSKKVFVIHSVELIFLILLITLSIELSFTLFVMRQFFPYVLFSIFKRLFQFVQQISDSNRIYINMRSDEHNIC